MTEFIKKQKILFLTTAMTLSMVTSCSFPGEHPVSDHDPNTTVNELSSQEITVEETPSAESTTVEPSESETESRDETSSESDLSENETPSETIDSEVSDDNLVGDDLAELLGDDFYEENELSGENEEIAVGNHDSDREENNGESSKTISWNENWEYASFSQIHDSDVTLYYTSSETPKNKVICVNAGHGTPNGDSKKTLSHPDGSPKIGGGTNASGETYSTAIASGMTMRNGTTEAVVTLKLAKVVKNRLLENGYDVLMIREEETNLDNIARTVFANENADCHIALHYDSTTSDKGAFYISVLKDSSYLSMEPVASHYEEHDELGESLIAGLEAVGRKIFSNGSMENDLTQTSYSTIPSVDLEVGDAVSDYSSDSLNEIADGILIGIDAYYGN